MRLKSALLAIALGCVFVSCSKEARKKEDTADSTPGIYLGAKFFTWSNVQATILIGDGSNKVIGIFGQPDFVWSDGPMAIGMEYRGIYEKLPPNCNGCLSGFEVFLQTNQVIRISPVYMTSR